MWMTKREVELLAIGAGPSNLGLAVALEELAPELADNALIIDRNKTIEWQQGMLLPWAKSQVAFAKDLVTLRNPRSKFSFVNHLHATGRLDDFINMGSLTPYRREIASYLAWVASALTRVRVELGRECLAIRPQRAPDGMLTGWLTTLADGSSISSRYLVIGTGRDPNIPEVFDGVPADRIVHSVNYRPRVAEFSKEIPYRAAVIGSSQSAAEVFHALRRDMPNCEVAWIMRSIGPTADQSSRFTNELYYPSFVDQFYPARAEWREEMLREMHKTNYSCITPAMLETLYGELYLDRLTGHNDRRLITMADITAAALVDDEVVLELRDRRTGTVTRLPRDMVFLGTGFSWRAPKLVRRLSDALGLDQVEVTRNYQLVLDEPSRAACYLQGFNEATHGLSDSLLSVLAQRAEDITLDILAHRTEDASRRDDVLAAGQASV
jgi:L-ornithine N5-monooxygenase